MLPNGAEFEPYRDEEAAWLSDMVEDEVKLEDIDIGVGAGVDVGLGLFHDVGT